MYEKIVIVTRKTRLESLVERFNTVGQARFYIEHAGGDFTDYQQEHSAYRGALDELRRTLDFGLSVQVVDRGFAPTFLFTEKDLVVTLGQDGLVANTAKYVGSQPIVAVNPDPARFDGLLLPYLPAQAPGAVRAALEGRAAVRNVTLAEAIFNDGQRLLAFNELFVGASSHVSARYNIRLGKTSAAHSSSGVLISTGAGSTGWLSSAFNMAAGVSLLGGGTKGKALRMAWEDPRLVFVVREPFVSKHSSGELAAGVLMPGHTLELESRMPSGGVVFSDGVESDFLAFNAGAVARVHAAKRKARLVVPIRKTRR